MPATDLFNNDAVVLPNSVHLSDANESFGAADFIRGEHKTVTDISAGSYTHTYDVGLPDGSIIYASVNKITDGVDNKLTLAAGDGTVEKFQPIDGVPDSDGQADLEIIGDTAFLKIGNIWQQFVDDARPSSSGSAIDIFQLTVTGINTIADLTFTPTSKVIFTVNGVIDYGITSVGNVVTVAPRSSNNDIDINSDVRAICSVG